MERNRQLHDHLILTTADLYRRLTLPTRFRVLGLRLVPFTVGHARLLDRLELDEINDGAGCLLAAKLCSMPADQAEAWVTSRFLGLRMILLAWPRWRMMRSAAEVNEGVRVFGQYLEESTKVPSFVGTGESGSPLGTPFAQHLRSVLLSRLGYTPEQVDRTPYLQAMWDYIAHMESEGRIEIPKDVSDDEEAALFAQADALLAKVKNGD